VQKSETIKYYEADSSPYGVSYGQWTVRWWCWFLSIEIRKSENFVFEKQATSEVMFLAGKVGDEDKSIPNRSCIVPSSSAILFPVINCEVNSLERPALTNEDDLIRYVGAEENTIILKECIVDGTPIPAQRVISDPKIFDVELNEYNAYGVRGGGKTVAAGDGYWVFLKPLSKGVHRITFRGSCEYGRLNSGADYKIKVV
jgi:hypothetical protein